MPHVKKVKPLTEICINFFFENQEFFCERFPVGELKDGVDVSLDTDKIGIHPFDELRKWNIANTLFNKSMILQFIIRFLKISANELLQKLVWFLRDKQSGPNRDRNKYPTWGRTYKIKPFLKLLVTPCLQTLDLILLRMLVVIFLMFFLWPQSEVRY